ncbi:hypothetical protein AK88_04727 [Plasmodium fragile]|uniref:Schizont-infected cell agglutination C-terminal domain-containing protein n=1 Tax=Plasmodium fragile TaxID=5857 RepID=A0A0D9QF47_PLAFR|nr:uncharacterized protein AK88_04727 [Plasmodium fragile]KJP85614.1 hypothetical protein AK88_04727 [Plasmodium fragile]
MIRDTQPASAAERRGQRSPRVHKRTIIELHLEVLHECEAPDWENVKEDYLQILVQEFAQEFAQDMIRDGKGYSSSLHAPITNEGVSGNTVSSTFHPPTDSEQTHTSPPNDPDPWSCMETMQLATDSCRPNEEDRWNCMETIQLVTHPCPPNDCDPWRCMETIQLEEEQSPALTGSEDATSACTQWINWIDRHKHIVRACTTQPWFLQLKAHWKQYLREHIVVNEDNGQRAFGEHRSIGCVEMKKHAWKKWVEQQHRQMSMYKEEWFPHLLHNVEADTVPQTGAVPGVETDLEVENVNAAQQMLRVRHVPRTQLHPQLYLNKPLCAKTWILILALVIEQCELECRLQEKELYVDALLHNMRH